MVVVKLTGANGPQKSDQKSSGHDQRDDDENNQYTHVRNFRSEIQAVRPTQNATTETELIGIKTAAHSGVNAAVQARDKAMILYMPVNPKAIKMVERVVRANEKNDESRCSAFP